MNNMWNKINRLTKRWQFPSLFLWSLHLTSSTKRNISGDDCDYSLRFLFSWQDSKETTSLSLICNDTRPLLSCLVYCTSYVTINDPNLGGLVLVQQKVYKRTSFNESYHLGPKVHRLSETHYSNSQIRVTFSHWHLWTTRHGPWDYRDINFILHKTLQILCLVLWSEVGDVT